ncbi:hypothetical protein C0992_007406 [Termitomyces sp. T32_za158]|nr:hypothetical protein C0992_007406 [Termitomyces sp. T32_za158]
MDSVTSQVDDFNLDDPTLTDNDEAFVMVPVEEQKLSKEKKKHVKRYLSNDGRPEDIFMDDPKDTDVIIPIIGITGAGKSSFINTLLGEDNVARVGHDLASQTDQIQHVVYPHPYERGKRVIVIDTPGFDHTTVDDREILRRIAVWLARSYHADMKLAGIIYLHEISQNNILPVRRNFDTFSKLCGPSAIRNVVLATTKWSDIPEKVGEKREKLLRDEHWKDMLDHGSVMLRYEGTQDSARSIIDQVLTHEPLDAVQIQRELIDLNKILAETEAGRSLYYSLDGLLEAQKITAARLQEQGSVHPEYRRIMLEADHKIRSLLFKFKNLNSPSLSKVKVWLDLESLKLLLNRVYLRKALPIKHFNMKAARYYGPGDIRVEDIAVPAASTGQVKVKVETNAGRLGRKCNFIGICGWGGGLSEFIAVDTKYLHVLPQGVPLEIGACIEPLAVAWYAIKRSGFSAGKSVLVLGAGPIGLFLLKILRSFDPSAIIISSEPATLRRAQALKHGATIALDPRGVNVPQEVLKATGGIGVDIAFDAAGIQAGLDVALPSVRTRGMIVNVAVWEKSPIIDVNLLLMKEISMTGILAYDRVHPELLAAVGSGKIPGIEDLITRKIALEDVVEKGFNALLHNKDAHIKILVNPSGNMLETQPKL